MNYASVTDTNPNELRYFSMAPANIEAYIAAINQPNWKYAVITSNGIGWRDDSITAALDEFYMTCIHPMVREVMLVDNKGSILLHHKLRRRIA